MDLSSLPQWCHRVTTLVYLQHMFLSIIYSNFITGRPTNKVASGLAGERFGASAAAYISPSRVQIRLFVILVCLSFFWSGGGIELETVPYTNTSNAALSVASSQQTSYTPWLEK